MTDLDALIRSVLADREVTYERVEEGVLVVNLKGEHKLSTNLLLQVGAHSLLLEAFVVRHPDENHEAFYRFLLERNARLYGVHFAVDHLGDVYLVGRIPLHAVTEDELDRLLGCVLEYSDSTFDQALEIGFGSAIRREWAWRTSRGEPVDNLRAFARFADPDARRGPATRP
ncbi:MAG: YbjN domain-containing protein [Candidatus Nanopelagicales bacterium]